MARNTKLLRGQQLAPRAAEGGLESENRSDQHVGFPGFDFLDRPDVEVHQFGQFFLR